MKRVGFTLVEVLVIMAVITVLSAIVLGALPGIWSSMARSRTVTEIQAMETALENFKTDGGQYPPGNATGYNPTDYIPSSVSLYTNLCGRNSITSAVTGKSYMTIKRSQLGTSGLYSYIQDPFGRAYGYCTNGPMNPTSFDLWSTAGKTDNAQASTNQWVANWLLR